MSLPSDKLNEIQKFAYPCSGHNMLPYLKAYPFWVKPIFVPVDTHNFGNCVMLFRGTC